MRTAGAETSHSQNAIVRNYAPDNFNSVLQVGADLRVINGERIIHVCALGETSNKNLFSRSDLYQRFTAIHFEVALKELDRTDSLRASLHADCDMPRRTKKLLSRASSRSSRVDSNHCHPVRASSIDYKILRAWIDFCEHLHVSNLSLRK